MFDLLLVLALLISGTFTGILSRVMLTRGNLILRASFSKKKATVIGGVGVGLVGGVGMMVLTSALTVASGETLTVTRLIVALIEGFVPIAVGVLIGFVLTGAKLTN